MLEVNNFIQIDDGHIVALPKTGNINVGDEVILLYGCDGENYIVETDFFEKIKSLSTDKSLTIDKLKLLTEIKL